jgi:hypothetical protein
MTNIPPILIETIISFVDNYLLDIWKYYQECVTIRGHGLFVFEISGLQHNMRIEPHRIKPIFITADNLCALYGNEYNIVSEEIALRNGKVDEPKSCYFLIANSENIFGQYVVSSVLYRIDSPVNVLITTINKNNFKL